MLADFYISTLLRLLLEEKQAIAAADVICLFIPKQKVSCITKLLQVMPQKDVPCRLATYTVASSHSKSHSLQAAQPSTVYFVNASKSADCPGLKADSNNITNDIVTLSFDPSTGLITQLVNKQANRSVDLGIDFVTYLAGKAELNGTTGPPSGVFRVWLTCVQLQVGGHQSLEVARLAWWTMVQMFPQDPGQVLSGLLAVPLEKASIRRACLPAALRGLHSDKKLMSPACYAELMSLQSS